MYSGNYVYSLYTITISTLILDIFIHRINKLRTLLQTNLNKHISIIQTLQRDLRQKTEFRLEALKDSNVQIMRSFKYVIDILCTSNYKCCVSQ